MTKFTPVGFTLALDRELVRAESRWVEFVQVESRLSLPSARVAPKAEWPSRACPIPKTSGVVLLALHTVLRIAYY
jgi:hypothetical protein